MPLNGPSIGWKACHECMKPTSAKAKQHPKYKDVKAVLCRKCRNRLKEETKAPQ